MNALSREDLLEMVLIIAGVYSRGALFLGKGGLFEESPYFWVLFRGKFIQKKPFLRRPFFGWDLFKGALFVRALFSREA